MSSSAYVSYQSTPLRSDLSNCTRHLTPHFYHCHPPKTIAIDLVVDDSAPTPQLFHRVPTSTARTIVQSGMNDIDIVTPLNAAQLLPSVSHQDNVIECTPLPPKSPTSGFIYDNASTDIIEQTKVCTVCNCCEQTISEDKFQLSR